MTVDRPSHQQIIDFADKAGLFRDLFAALRNSAVSGMVIIFAAPDTREGEYLKLVAQHRKKADEVSRLFAAQRRARVPRFLVGLTTASSLREGLSEEAIGDLDAAIAAGGVPTFIVDRKGYWCGASVERLEAHAADGQRPAFT